MNQKLPYTQLSLIDDVTDAYDAIVTCLASFARKDFKSIMSLSSHDFLEMIKNSADS